MEDDYRVVQSEGLSFLHVVDEKGEYTEAVPFLKGRFVKDCDVDIVRYLAKEGLLYHKENMNIAIRIAGVVIHHYFIMQEKVG